MEHRGEHDASTEGMRAGGYYDAHSEYQRSVIESGDEAIRAAVDGLEPAASRGHLTIADYGAGTGATSVHAMGAAIAALREHGADLPVLSIHNDVATNDFTQLFRNVTADGGYTDTPGAPIYPGAVAGSFFTQVMPPASVDLGMCSNAAHWLREQPRLDTPGCMYFSQAAADARAELAAQAARDWLAFLEARAAELTRGGRLLVQGIGVSADGEHVSADRLLRVMWDVAFSLADDGLLDGAALDDYVFPVYCRSAAELTAPVEDGPLFGRLEVVAVHEGDVANPYWAAFQRDGDAAAYAKAYTEFVRAFAEPTMRTNLFEPTATTEDAATVCDEYFARLEASSAADPEAGRYEAWIVRLVLARTPDPAGPS